MPPSDGADQPSARRARGSVRACVRARAEKIRAGTSGARASGREGRPPRAFNTADPIRSRLFAQMTGCGQTAGGWIFARRSTRKEPGVFSLAVHAFDVRDASRRSDNPRGGFGGPARREVTRAERVAERNTRDGSCDTSLRKTGRKKLFADTCMQFQSPPLDACWNGMPGKISPDRSDGHFFMTSYTYDDVDRKNLGIFRDKFCVTNFTIFL